MDNLLTYLKWRGDASFPFRPFCEVDNIVLSAIAYLDFQNIVPDNEEAVPLPDVYRAYCTQGREGRLSQKFMPILALMAASRRFGTARLSHYRQITDTEQQTQFAAVHIELEGGLTYIAFRGTDDTIVGWREDFALGSQIVPAQRMAADYLAMTMQPGRRYIIGGHSKGGNLAVYGALQLPQELLDNVLTVYNNDGPGLSADIVPSSQYQRLEGKLVQFVPQFCLIGSLFPHGQPDKIVASSADGVLQHDIDTWQVDGDALVAVSCTTSQLYVDIVNQWINSANMEQRQAFTRDFFDALEAGGATTVEQITGNGIDGFGTILLSLARSEPRTKIVIGKFVRSFLQNIRRIHIAQALRTRETYSGALLFVLGLFCMQWPSATLKLLSAGLGAMGMAWCGYKLMQFSTRRDLTDIQKRMRVVVYLVLFTLATSLFLNERVALISVHVVLGVLFVATAIQKFRAMLSAPKGELFKKLWLGLTAVFSLLLGIAAFTTTTELPEEYVFIVGLCLVIYGTVQSAQGLYHNGKYHVLQSNSCHNDL